MKYKKINLACYVMENTRIQINNPKDIYDYVKNDLIDKKQEHFLVVGLNTNNEILYKEVVAIGIKNACIIDPSIIYRKAIIENCNCLIVVHNHPSGNLKPSDEDIIITKTLIIIHNYLQFIVFKKFSKYFYGYFFK